jgi:Cu+-exporting ATPase
MRRSPVSGCRGREPVGASHRNGHRRAAKNEGHAIPTVSNFEAVPGFGAIGIVVDVMCCVGADRYMARLGIDVSGFTSTAERLGQEGKSPLYAAIGGRLAAIIAVADPIKPTTFGAIAALHDLGLKVAMITGDNRRTAEAIARILGIDEVVAEVLPDGKVEAREALREGGRKVAFVGDGINDAPALAEADVGSPSAPAPMLLSKVPTWC